MSKMNNLFISIQEDLDEGKLSFAEIASKHEVPSSWVVEVADAMKEMDEIDQYIMENDYMDDY